MEWHKKTIYQPWYGSNTMDSSHNLDPEFFAQRHRGGVLLERYGIDLFLHPYLGFSLAPRHRSGVINTDDEGFRLSDSPFGVVDSATWLSNGGGGILLGNSVTVGLAASSDRGTIASHLAFLTGRRQLNLGVCAANSHQELIAAVPFLHAASTVVIIGGGPDFGNMLGARTPHAAFGPVSYERTFAQLAQIPLFELAGLASGKSQATEVRTGRRSRRAGTKSNPDPLPRVEIAARRRLRDLAFLARAVGDRTQILLCLQPFATPRTRDVTAEERAHYDFDAPVFGIFHNACEEYWGTYADLLAGGCADIGVSFLNLAADQFAGYTFADNLHLNDEGNRQAARMIHRALEGAPVAAASAPHSR